YPYIVPFWSLCQLSKRQTSLREYFFPTSSRSPQRYRCRERNRPVSMTSLRCSEKSREFDNRSTNPAVGAIQPSAQVTIGEPYFFWSPSVKNSRLKIRSM